MKYLLTFRRAPVDCDMAEAFCPVRKPCNKCNEYFNSLPLRERIAIEIPRRWGLLGAYGWRAAMTQTRLIWPKRKGGDYESDR